MPDQQTDSLRALVAELRELAAECRKWTGVPCQSEHAWHAADYEGWAVRIEEALEHIGTPQGER